MAGKTRVAKYQADRTNQKLYFCRLACQAAATTSASYGQPAEPVSPQVAVLVGDPQPAAPLAPDVAQPLSSQAPIPVEGAQPPSPPVADEPSEPVPAQPVPPVPSTQAPAPAEPEAQEMEASKNFGNLF